MTNLRFNYTHPWLLLLLIPALLFTLIPHFRIVKKYRRTRNRIISLVLHLLTMVLAINLLAGLTVSYEVPNIENEVILLVDTSASGEDERAERDEFVRSVINVADKDYNVGIVKFGYDQKYVAELSPDTDEAYKKYIESEDPDSSSTDLASALEYAKGLFRSPSAKIVIISDGIETDGRASAVIKDIVSEGIKIDTVCFPSTEGDEVQILSVSTPERRVVPGEEFSIDMIVKSTLGSEGSSLLMKVFDNGVQIKSEEITVRNKENVISTSITLEDRSLHELRFEIESSRDRVSENNVYHTYLDLSLFDNVLLIERYEGESEQLKSVLSEKFNVTDISLESDLMLMPKDIHELAEYEQVVLVNVAYGDMTAEFEKLLNEYVYDLGGGLFTVGGKNDTADDKTVAHSYNRDDMESSSYYKQMLPVNVVNYIPPVAVMIVVDCSDSMNREGKIEAAVEGAEACLDALGDKDFCGVMAFQSNANEVLQVLPVSQKEEIKEAIRALKADADGGTIFADAIQRAGQALSVIQNVDKKHIIMVTDGEPSDTYEEYEPFIGYNVADGITMSIVTIDVKANFRQLMEDTAAAGGGQHYNVKSSELDTIPTVMKTVLEVKPIPELDMNEAFIPVITNEEESAIFSEIDIALLPKLSGYYGIVLKEGAVALLARDNIPVYAQWKYGEGSVGSFMSGFGGEWGEAFLSGAEGRAIMLSIVNNLFPIYDVSAEKFDYVMKTDNFKNQVNVYGIFDGQSVKLEVKPVGTALSDIIGESVPVTVAENNRRFIFEIKCAGLYRIDIKLLDETGATVSERVAYKTFSYSEEYNEFTEREPIGEELLALLAADGGGIVIADPTEVFANFAKTLRKEYDPRILFLILAIVLVLLDIAVRKFKFKWPHELVREYKQRKADKADERSRGESISSGKRE